MKIWLLLPTDRHAVRGPWRPWYDKAFGFVVQAYDETEARLLAHNDAGDENDTGANPWLDRELSTCVELKPDNKPAKIIMKDFAAA